MGMKIRDFERVMKSIGGQLAGSVGTLLPPDVPNAEGMVVVAFIPTEDPIIIVTQLGSAPPQQMSMVRNALEAERLRLATLPRMRMLGDRIRHAAQILRLLK